MYINNLFVEKRGRTVFQKKHFGFWNHRFAGLEPVM